MSGFSYQRATDPADALIHAALPGSAYIAGGTDLLQLWKLGVQAPAQLVDISHLKLADITPVDGGVLIGALARLSDVASHPGVHRVIADAILASASGQIRTMATMGGNLLQRTRCAYFRTADLPCNKREPGSGCGAITGENRGAALFGTSPACVATHPSDLAVALSALNAELDILGPSGTGRVTLADFYRLPAETPDRDTNLAPGELITGIFVPRATGASIYLKIRDRASFEFAVVSLAACLQIENGIITTARLAAGGVAPMPWRLAAAEAALIGRAPDAATFNEAAALAADGAKPLAQNGFKITLLRRAVLRALTTIGGQA